MDANRTIIYTRMVDRPGTYDVALLPGSMDGAMHMGMTCTDSLEIPVYLTVPFQYNLSLKS